MQPTLNQKFVFTHLVLILLLCLLLTACRVSLPENQPESTLSQPEVSILTLTPQPTPLLPITNTPSPFPITPTPTINSITPIISNMAPSYTYEVINIYPHDPSAFTQGLLFHNDYLYESTGRHGQSSLRKVELETGKILSSFELSENYFAEGLTLYQNKLYQLTWQENTGFIYEKDSLTLVSSFYYPNEGWGLAVYNESLIMSDGTNTLHFLDPETLQETKSIAVLDKNGQPLEKINELEVISGYIFANIWQTDRIVIINPQNGIEISEINLIALISLCPYDTQGIDVLNGIAFDPDNQRLFVTGKLWPCLFEIRLIPE